MGAQRRRLTPAWHGGPARGTAGHDRNAGIDAARGDFIAPLDADDLWHPDKLRLHLEALRQAVEAIAIPHLHSPHAVCTVSIGYAAAEPDDSPLAAISRADGCMYLAKRKGRNRVEGVPEDQEDRELFSGFMTEVA